LQGRDIESFRTRDGLSQSTVFTLCEDHEGNLWAGTKHGLNQFVDRRTIPLTVSEGLPSNDTGPLLQDRAGRVWVGTLDKGLARYDGRHCSLAATVEQGLSSNSILSLADGGNDDLWIGTDQGLCLMRDGRIIDCFTSEHGLPSNEISCLCRDRRGVLWAGTSRGLAEFDSGRFVRPDGDEGALRLPILALVEYGGKCVVTSTEGGRIFQCDDRHFRPFGGDSIGSQNVHAFYEDRDASLWMGTLGNGLELVDGDTTLRITVKDGLYDDDIFGIVADDEDRLWMACSRGIFFVSRPELRRFARGEITNVTSTPFSPTDALRTVECQSGVQPAVWRMQDGHIWFSTNHGVIVIDPSNLRRVLPLPQVHVEEVLVNGQDVNPGQVGNLPPGRTTVSFRYTALSYASPTRITFRYRLDGFDKEWIEAGSRREAFYTNLPPGSYRFRVSAMNPQSAWSDATLPVEFTLAPYFYQRVWFIPLMFAFVVMVAMVVFRLRVLQVKAHWNAVVAERGRIARELHDTLIQGFSGVTMQMQALAAALRPSRERAKLEEIIEDAGLCLRDARRSVGGLRIASTNDAGLAAAVAQAARQLTETRDVRLVLQVSNCRNVPTDVEYNLLRIAQEAISNAVKYSEGRTIEVTLSSTPQQLCLTVRDDGAGFVVNNTEQLQSGHYGLIGMRERAKQINAELHVLSEPGHGTTVRVELPLTALAAIKSTNHRRSGERFSEESS
jgi:signal transduction histidine kinase